MIEIDESLLPRALKLYPTSDWSNTIENSFDRIEQILDDAIKNNEKLVLLYVSPEKHETGMFPPTSTLLRMVSRLISLREKIKKGINYNVIWIRDPSDKFYLDMLLKVYTPANAIHMATTKAEVADLINGHIGNIGYIGNIG